MSYAAQAPQQGYTTPAPQPMEVPKQLRSGVTLMFTLLAIGVVSFALDLVVTIIVGGELAEPYKNLTGEELGFLAFNPGTMFGNLLFAIVIGVLALAVKKGSNGARITGAVFSILFMIGGLGGLVIAMLNLGATEFVASQLELGEVVPKWYLAAFVFAIAQVVVSIIAMVKLFNRNTADYCNQPK